MKLVLAVFFPIAMIGSTLSATVDCGSGPIGGSGVASASCGVPGSSTASASVSGFGSVSNFGIDVGVDAPFGLSVFPTASAMIDVDLSVNIIGSTGTALFIPCVVGNGDNVLAPAAATVTASIAGGGSVSSDSDHDLIDTCGGGIPFLDRLFTFGQPFTIDLTLAGQAQVYNIFGGLVEGRLALDGYDVVDTNLNPIPAAVISVTLVPEPYTALLMLLAIGLTILGACHRNFCVRLGFRRSSGPTASIGLARRCGSELPSEANVLYFVLETAMALARSDAMKFSKLNSGAGSR